MGYLECVSYFIETHHLKAGKPLAFHAKAVTCIRKGKVGKKNEFCRVFQLGRLGGNFMMVLKSTSLRQDDKQSLQAMVTEHLNVFGTGVLQSLGTDKGYYSKENVLALKPLISEVNIQQPTHLKTDLSGLSEERKQKLNDRRAGAEPLIGHLKNEFGLDKSRMKSDETTLASGYRSVLGFNLHQLVRHLQGIPAKTRLAGG
ncbi:MAG: hypothetical protein HQM12_22910 [SAR324 cluster bacterium]|nr:hypothetical protein [SAR324 cluster bacterium]